MIEALISGLLLGGFYAILAAGLSMMFGVMKIINLAHGDLAILGAYGVIALTARTEMSPWLALSIVLPVMALLGALLQRWLFARTLRAGILLPLLVTFGLGAVLQNGLYGVFGSEAQSLSNSLGDLAWENWQLPGGIIVGKLPVITFMIAVLVLTGLQLMLSFTKLGRSIRAASSDAEAAALCGMDARRVHQAAAAIAVVLAGLAGTLLTMHATASPYAGPTLLIQAFEAVVIGGIGSLWGTLIGGIILGIAQSMGALWDPQGFQLAGHLLFFVVLGARLWRQHRHQMGQPNLPTWLSLRLKVVGRA